MAAAAVVRQAGVPRHVLGADQIRQAHLGAVASGLARDRVQHALDDEHRLGLPRAAVGRDRHAVRVAALEHGFDGRDAIGSGEHRGGEERDHQAARSVGAGVVDEPVAQGQQAPLVVEAHRDLVLLLALLGGGEHVFEAVLDPAHRAGQPARQEGDEHVLGIYDQLGPEAAAHVGRDHADVMGRQLQQVREELTNLVRDLR